jgi:type VI secretion system protein ImpC
MPKHPSSDLTDVQLASAMEGVEGVLDPDAPLRLLVLGDFGGAEVGPVGTRTVHPVDRDVLDELFGRLLVKADLSLGEGRDAGLELRELDDFHPDRLVQRFDLFAELRETRERLDDPKTFAEAAESVRAWEGSPPEPVPTAAETEDVGDDIIRDLLAGAASRTRPGVDAAFEAELKALVRPHLVPGEAPDLPRLRAMVDGRCSDLLRTILRDPRLKGLEAAWRGLDLLVRRVDDESVRVFLLDVSRAALAEDLRGAASLQLTGLYRRVVTETVETPGAAPWGAIVGLYDFGPTLADAVLLARIAKIARASGAPFLAAAREEIVGCASLAATPDPDGWQPPEGDGAAVWEELRALPEAAWVALALPRLLLRLPYGAKTDPIESFPFEEMAGPPEHGAYLWGNPALLSALALANEAEAGRQASRPDAANEFGGLPFHLWESGGETHVTPPTEVVLTYRAAEKLLEAGLVPVLSFKGQEVVRVARLQSIASPLRELAGKRDGQDRRRPGP